MGWLLGTAIRGGINMESKYVYIIFGDIPRSDGDNIHAVCVSKKKAEEYKSGLESLNEDTNYHIEQFLLTDMIKNSNKPLKEGKWIRKLCRDYITPPYYEYRCSICNRTVLDTEKNCPYCLSEMKDIIDN